MACDKWGYLSGNSSDENGRQEMDNTADKSMLDQGTWSRGILGDGDLTHREFDDQPLLRDVAFNRHSKNRDRGWTHVSPLANGQNDVGVDGIAVKLLRGLPPQDEVAKVMSRAMNATTGWDVALDVDANVPDWQDLLRGGLQAVMEAFVIVFEVSGVSRACTHQIVRSRRAGFHQQSQRATSYVTPDGVPANVRVPESVWRKWNKDVGVRIADDGDYVTSADLEEAWKEALYWSRRAYRLACELDVSYQDARYILPEGTENYIMCEYSLREFLAVYDYRACSMFNWEITHVVREMGRLLKEQSPWIVGTGAEPKISCERTRSAIDGGLLNVGAATVKDDVAATSHACTFQGWENVEGQCDFPWARESNRTFKPSRTIG